MSLVLFVSTDAIDNRWGEILTAAAGLTGMHWLSTKLRGEIGGWVKDPAKEPFPREGLETELAEILKSDLAFGEQTVCLFLKDDSWNAGCRAHLEKVWDDIRTNVRVSNGLLVDR